MTDRREEDARLAFAFAFHSSPGAYALLLGAGVSMPSGIPVAWEVHEDLVRQVARLESEDAGEDPAAWYETKYREQPDYSSLLERLAPTPVARQELLAHYFEPTPEEVEEGRKQPTGAHRSLARLVSLGVVKVIVTLNFDRLMEQALRELRIEPTVISSPADIEGMAPLHTLDACVIHLHGDYKTPTSMRNTAVELGKYDQRTLDLLHLVLGEYGLLIAGWSAKYDPVLRDAIVSEYTNRHVLGWVEPSPMSEKASEVLTLKRGLLMVANADDGIGRLADDVESLRVRQAAHPLTVAVVVETAKRDLAGGRVAISLHDTLNKSIADLHAIDELHLDRFDDKGAAVYGGYEVMVQRIQEATRLPAALVAVLAYWGDEQTDVWWIQELQRFATQSKASGSTSLLQLRQIAGVDLFYAAGVAAVISGRFELLGRILNMTRDLPHGSGVQYLSDVYEPDNALRFTTSHGHDLYDRLSPLLVEALGVGPLALEDAWQRFEVIRLAVLLRNHDQFDVLYQAVDESCNDLETTVHNLKNQTDREDADQAIASMDRLYGLAVGFLADRVNDGRVHVLAGSYAARGRVGAPVAIRLAEEVRTEGDNHPLITAKVFPGTWGAADAIDAVSVSLGRAGNDLMTSRIVSHQATVIPDELWIDSSKTSEERARAAKESAD